MRHHRYTIRFGRQRSHYKATLRHLVCGLIISKSIRTTKVKAKEASRLADKLVTITKNRSVSNQRKAYSILRDRKLVSLLFNDIAPLFKDRNGGYTRVILLGARRGDNAEMAILEFVEKPKIEPPKKAAKPEKKVAAPDTPTVKAEVEPEKPKPQKEERGEKKEERKIDLPPQKEPKKPGRPMPKPGFFKKFFGRKREA